MHFFPDPQSNTEESGGGKRKCIMNRRQILRQVKQYKPNRILQNNEKKIQKRVDAKSNTEESSDLESIWLWWNIRILVFKKSTFTHDGLSQQLSKCLEEASTLEWMTKERKTKMIQQTPPQQKNMM